MRGHLDAARVRIEAPDAVSAFRLERRLRHLHPTAVGRGRQWEVDISEHGGPPREAEITGAVRGWLGDVGLAETTMWIDGWPRYVSRPEGDEP